MPLRTQKPTESKEKPTSRNEGKYTERYKYVRFVEKKKIVRSMRQLQQKLSKTTEQEAKTEIENQLAELRKDLMYVERFPGDEKYVSLFPSKGEVSAECIAKRTKIRDKIVAMVAKQDRRANKDRSLDVIKNDDFFASDTPSPEPVKSVNKKQTNTSSKPTPSAQKSISKPPHFERKPVQVHPSWEAKKTNSRLTGSIAETKFGGNRLVFSEDEN
jgi:hypothetical protein